jgi:hypothetical protein
MKFSKTIAQVTLVLAALPVAALAGETGTVYTQFGTNGLGIGYAASVSDDFAARGQFNVFKQSFSGDVGDFGAGSTLTVDLSLSSVQLVGDWYPTDSGFRVSGGVVFNNNKITVNGTGATVGTTGSQTVNAEIKMSDSLSPYVGVGYSTRPKDASGFGFNFDLGVMFQNPKVTLTATGAVPASQADIDAQVAKVQDAIDKLKTMPVFGIGVSYAF